jgi:hypothetical protein
MKRRRRDISATRQSACDRVGIVGRMMPPKGGLALALSHPQARHGAGVRLQQEQSRLGLLVGVAGGDRKSVV